MARRTYLPFLQSRCRALRIYMAKYHSVIVAFMPAPASVPYIALIEALNAFCEAFDAAFDNVEP